jgi:predicted ATPase
MVGRRSECEALDRVVAAARGRRGEAIVLHGEAGIGKTALLE